MSRPRSTTAQRLLGAVRLAWGAALLARPATVARLAGSRLDGRALAVSRVLAVRQTAQAVLELAGWGPAARYGPAVDAAHSASMVALAAADPRRRRLAGADAVLAALFALGGRLAGGRPR